MINIFSLNYTHVYNIRIKKVFFKTLHGIEGQRLLKQHTFRKGNTN